MPFNPSRQLVTKSISVGELLKSSYFEIPPNQREYRWGDDQRKKLWDDLILTVSNDFESESQDHLGHFLGAIVVIGGETSHDQQRWEVIDGQQRLTTLTILANCIEQYVDVIDDKKIRKRIEHILHDCVLSPVAHSAPRIKLNREHEFYETSIIERGDLEEKKAYWDYSYNKKSEVQTNIKDSFEFFFAKIESYIDGCEGEQASTKISNLAEALIENFYVLVVRTESLWLAYRLFETLNERGLDLSQADLIRNVVLEHARIEGAKVASKVSKMWTELIDNYEDQSVYKLDLPQIIQFSYTYRHEKIKKEQIFDKVSNDLRSGRYGAEELAAEFRKDSELWSAFLLGDLSNWTEDLADAQYAITDPLWKSHASPFILAAMLKYGNNIDILTRLIKLTEHYLFRQGLVCGDSVSVLQDFFSEAARMLTLGAEVNEIKEFFKRNSSTSIFVDRFKTFEVKNMKQGFYTIWKIEKKYLSEVGFKPKNQSAAQHLEHIMPKKPGKEWNGIDSNEAFKSFLNRIGNLIILDSAINQHIKNKGIDYKIKNSSGMSYYNSNLLLARQVFDKFDVWNESGSWGFESIKRRQSFLAENFADPVWTLDL